jgi:hypothetical protein
MKRRSQLVGRRLLRLHLRLHLHNLHLCLRPRRLHQHCFYRRRRQLQRLFLPLPLLPLLCRPPKLTPQLRSSHT